MNGSINEARDSDAKRNVQADSIIFQRDRNSLKSRLGMETR